MKCVPPAWVTESAAAPGRTGTWSKPVSYDAATLRASLGGENVYAPHAASAGSYVTLKVVATFRADGEGKPGADVQGALRIGPKGGFQVWTSGGWLDVAAAGVAPVSGAEYGATFTFDYAHGRYSVAVREATGGGWKALKSAAGAQTFPIAKPGAYALSSVMFSGETEFTSLEGSYTSGRRE